MAVPTLPLDASTAGTRESGRFSVVFDDVWISFGDVDVLKGVSFKLPFGETKALFGVAGSGKSTILKLALGLLKPHSGRVVALGEDVDKISKDELFQLRGRIGMVFQESALFDSLTVSENVAFRLTEEHGIYDDAIDQRVRESLRFVELEHTVDLSPSELSGGMRRRVAIARAIINEPKILLADEPTGNLDSKNSEIVLQMLRQLNKELGQTVVMITHNPEATTYFDRVVHMRDGVIVDGVPAD